MRVLCIVMCFMLVFSFTTSLLGAPAPKLQTVLEKLSSIEVNVQELINTVYFDTSVLDTSYITVTDETPWYEVMLAYFNNWFIDFIAIFAVSINYVVGGIMILMSVVSALLDICEVGIYLLFGIDVDYNLSILT